LHIVILEGARGTGKSTLAVKLRQRISETTLINFTGFHDDGDEGLKKVVEYYNSWMSLFEQLGKIGHDSRYVFDRFFFTETVFSELYKEYNFKSVHRQLCSKLDNLGKDVKIDVVFLTVEDREELQNRLTRDKVPFGKVEESVDESIKQQNMYYNLFYGLKLNYSNINIHAIETDGKTNEDVYAEIENIVKTAQ